VLSDRQRASGGEVVVPYAYAMKSKCSNASKVAKATKTGILSFKVSFMSEITINTYYHNLCKVLAPEVIMIMLNKKATPV